MKRQAVVRTSNEEWEQINTNESKRMKLLNNETTRDNVQKNPVDTQTMDSIQNGNLLDHNHEDLSLDHNHEDPSFDRNYEDMSVISNNEMISNQQSISTVPSQTKDTNEQISSRVFNGNGSNDSSSDSNVVNNCNHNGPCDEVFMKVSSCESDSHDHNHEDLSVSSNNESTNEQSISTFPSQMHDANEQISSEVFNGNRSNDNSSDSNLISNNNHNCDEVVVKVSSCESGIISEMYFTESRVNSVTCSEDKQFSEKSCSTPVLLNHGDHNDAHSGESTDSFQSEGFEAVKNANVAGNAASTSSQAQNRNEETESSTKPDVIKPGIDIESLPLSYMKVTQLEGHPDVIFSLVADDDFILSSSADTTVRVWSTVDNDVISMFSGHADAVTSLLLLDSEQSKFLKSKLPNSNLPAERVAITGSYDCHLKVWSVFDGREIQTMYTFNGITCIGYLESVSYVVVGTEGGKLEIWDVIAKKAVYSVRAHEDSVTDIKVKDFNIYSTSIDGTVKVWLFEDDEIYPVYTRKRKEVSSNKTDLVPAQWKTVAVSDNVMYLGDNTTNLKVLDWRAGRLRLFKNQIGNEGVCECVLTTKDLLLTTFHDSASDTGGINVWKLPEMIYICTLSGEVQDICSLAVVQSGRRLRIVSGGHQLLVWDFNFAEPPKKGSEDAFYVCELETVGAEIDEKLVDVQPSDISKRSTSEAESSSNRWCNIM